MQRAKASKQWSEAIEKVAKGGAGRRPGKRKVDLDAPKTAAPGSAPSPATPSPRAIQPSLDFGPDGDPASGQRD